MSNQQDNTFTLQYHRRMHNTYSHHQYGSTTRKSRSFHRPSFFPRWGEKTEQQRPSPDSATLTGSDSTTQRFQGTSRTAPAIEMTRHMQPEATDVIYVGHLSPTVSEKDLFDVFSAYGHIESIFRRRANSSSAETDGPSYYAFIRFSDSGAAFMAISGRDGTVLAGRRITVRPRNNSGGTSMRGSPNNRFTPAPSPYAREARTVSVHSVHSDRSYGSESSRLLIVANIPHDMYPEDLYRLFSRFGAVTSLVIHEQMDEYGRRYGDVLMASSSFAKQALESLHGMDVRGYVLDVNYKPSGAQQPAVVPLMYWAQPETGPASQPIMYPRYATMPIPNYGPQYAMPFTVYWNPSTGDYYPCYASAPEYFYPGAEYQTYGTYSHYQPYSARPRTPSARSGRPIQSEDADDGTDTEPEITSIPSSPRSDESGINSPDSRHTDGRHSVVGTVNYRPSRPVSRVRSLTFDTDSDGRPIIHTHRAYGRQSTLKAGDKAIPDVLKPIDPCNLFVKNLDDTVITGTEQLKGLFASFGDIFSAHLATYPNTSVSRNFGFVAFRSPDDALKAKEAMDGKLIGKKRIFVSFAERKDDRSQRLRQIFYPPNEHVSPVESSSKAPYNTTSSASSSSSATPTDSVRSIHQTETAETSPLYAHEVDDAGVAALQITDKKKENTKSTNVSPKSSYSSTGGPVMSKERDSPTKPRSPKSHAIPLESRKDGNTVHAIDTSLVKATTINTELATSIYSGKRYHNRSGNYAARRGRNWHSGNRGGRSAGNERGSTSIRLATSENIPTDTVKVVDESAGAFAAMEVELKDSANKDVFL
ncbi:hypothetical protein V1525DRAFT_396032 [Lipomyces kononenkoae]|uniref:Uncharacterized protein n=1 Tax=Lipomyces kononenkoae TaxID=34357 RepID=A0ACC3T8V7_LIPKO